MEFLPQSNRASLGEEVDATRSRADGKHVVIIGGGDTGADCLGTAHRQGAASITQLEIMPRPPEDRPAGQPWPTYPMIVPGLLGPRGGRRAGLRRLDPGVPRRRRRQASARCGWSRWRRGRQFQPRSRAPSGRSRPTSCCSRWASPGRSRPAWSSSSASSSTTAATSPATTATPPASTGVFVAGDAGRGQSLIVWAIAEGRAAAAAVDRYLTGSTNLPVADPADGPSARRLTAALRWIDQDSLGSSVWRRAKIVCTLGPATSDSGDDPRARRGRAWTSPGST